MILSSEEPDMRTILFASIFAATILLAAGCASDHPARDAARDVENKFEEGATGHGQLTEPDQSNDPANR